MPSLALSDQLIWFAHCPKSGGTSIEQFMVARWGDAVGHLHWGWDLWWRDGGWRVANPPNSPQHLVWADAVPALPRAPDAVFAVVRDPVARIASEYRWQRLGRRGTRLGKALAYLPFPLWLRVMLAMAKRNPHAFDNHLRPQSDFVPATARVFHLENGLEPVIGWLAETVGDRAVASGLPHAIRTPGQTPIDPRDAALIHQTFRADYQRFGYHPPQAHPVARPIADRLAARLAPLAMRLDQRGLL